MVIPGQSAVVAKQRVNIAGTLLFSYTLVSASVVTVVAMLGVALVLDWLRNSFGAPVAQKRLEMGFRKKRCESVITKEYDCGILPE